MIYVAGMYESSAFQLTLEPTSITLVQHFLWDELILFSSRSVKNTGKLNKRVRRDTAEVIAAVTAAKAAFLSRPIISFRRQCEWQQSFQER